MPTTLISEPAAKAEGTSAVSELTRGDKAAKRASDLRANARFPFTAAATAVEITSGARMDARTTDLGAGGCYVDTMSPFPTGAVVRLRLTKDGESFRADATVANCQVGVGMALQFAPVAREQVLTLNKWLNELRGDASPETSALELDERVLSENDLKDQQHYALEELLILLMRKGVLAEGEGEPILRRLIGGTPPEDPWPV